ncbi:RNA polymerase sigma factor SigJ [Glycomyces arizonensis]|uniref:RNA polymerase sigma factor SigJ n=1 Tax=Glycomyces arizonensis TaxID=256035 RepID=UPI00040A0E0E|nr:RNA polymerase sigma factor SigJ [Glycomyces arizonensis]
MSETVPAERFEEQRPRLRAVAYRMLGSLSEADDALQETWLRASGTDTADVENLPAWLTTVTARVCLNMLRSRRRRREESMELRVPDPVVSPESGLDPEHEALLADSVGLAMLVVLETLKPSERLAFVLHDMFAVPFEDIAEVIEKTPAAARQLASRARRRVEDQTITPERDRGRERAAVDAFLAASQQGDFDALVAVLDPDVVLRSDGGTARPALTSLLRGARTVAGQAVMFTKFARLSRPVLVNGAPGFVVVDKHGPVAVLALTVANDRIAAIDILADPERLERLEL